MDKPSYSPDKFREEKPPFFHMGISVDKSGGLILNDDARKELEEHIESLSRDLKKKSTSTLSL